MLEETVPKYLETLEFKIKQQWFPPKISKFKTAIVRFQLHRDGSLSDLFLERSSGQKLLDQAAIRAIRNVSPVSGIPEGCPQALKLRFRFDYYDAAVLADPKRRARKHLELLSRQANLPAHFYYFLKMHARFLRLRGKRLVLEVVKVQHTLSPLT